jgi:Coenzyme PQQ synthesis protein D (PqqD)
VTTATRFQISANVHARRFDDELVVLHLGVGAYFSLDPVGSTIWDQLVDGKGAEEAVAAILAEYDIDEATARADVERLAEELVEAGLLSLRT